MAIAVQEVKETIDNLVLAAVGHPIRRKVLKEMSKKIKGEFIPKSPKMLSEILDEKLANVSYHVRLLADSDVLELVDTPQRRGAVEHFYVRNNNEINQKINRILKQLVGR